MKRRDVHLAALAAALDAALSGCRSPATDPHPANPDPAPTTPTTATDASSVAVLEVTIVPCLMDNYAYLVRPKGQRQALVVDPSESEPVIAAVERENLELVGILNTHHHHDHVGGNEGLRAKFGGLQIVGFEGDASRIPGLTRGVRDNEELEIANMKVVCLHVPGHTTGAMAYLCGGKVFTGDTLFAAGCGRLFEGTAEMMNRSLNERLAKLPATTQVYCGHEYTVKNLRFALHVEPDNADMKAALDEAISTRAKGLPTIPTTIARELATNPFMRVTEPGLNAAFGGVDPASVLGALRKAKDEFDRGVAVPPPER